MRWVQPKANNKGGISTSDSLLFYFIVALWIRTFFLKRTRCSIKSLLLKSRAVVFQTMRLAVCVLILSVLDAIATNSAMDCKKYQTNTSCVGAGQNCEWCVTGWKKGKCYSPNEQTCCQKGMNLKCIPLICDASNFCGAPESCQPEGNVTTFLPFGALLLHC